ncbi:sensor histidine kinase [Aurantibacillus circumpalustris]|uniref:sensor histidine kinase n=1 Tax=Aurantibacillus circumpalustris TaxID=3036359 RepID=UPI00295B6D5C|nr:7TM diverse intracellular signaling domain-containing protein [Aurantibacillus circumpalustris]
MNRLKFLFFLFLLGKLSIAQIVVTEPQTQKLNVNFNNSIFFIEDKSGKLTFNEVINSNDFTPVKKNVPNFGITNSAYWLKMEIKNLSHRETYRLQISQPALDEIDFYQKNKAGVFEESKSGERLPFDSRDFFDPNYIYKIRLDTMNLTEIYLRVRSRDNLQIPIKIDTQENTFQNNKIKDYIFGIFAGIMIVMLLYNTFLYVTVRDKTYLYYIIYLATVILVQCGIQGYTFQYLWPNSPFLAQWSVFIFSPMVGVASAYFMRVFLNTFQFTPKFDKGYKYFTIAYTVTFVFAIFGLFSVSYTLITACAASLSLYMMINAFLIYKKGYKPARFFLVAWSLFLTGVTIYSMTNVGFLPINNFTFYTMPFGAAAEVILLSLALADRINVLKREKEASQVEALLISQQNQKLITEQNILLEQKVHERTLELEETNEELNVTLTYLKDTQTQLVNAEKMASLGQLTAGIAHEINNPINFVSANLKPLKTDISEVFEVVDKYESITPETELVEKLKEIDLFKKKIDLVYLRGEIGTLLMGIEDGARRTAEIVSGLKNFSRLDESDIKEANINEGIESTLVLLRSTIQSNIQVITNLTKLPAIECFPGKLNQVFMNVISNALYAMSKTKSEEKNKLIITTFEKEDHVHVVFEDTGTGMTKEVQEKVFEPFFTTKDVGEGTGLGMSIVFKIVESHNAKMEIDSELGKGTKITLILNKKISQDDRILKT